MGLNWLSALVLLSGITPKLLVFGEGKWRGLICAMALSEVSFYFQENRRPHDTLQAAAVPRVYSLDRVCAAQRRCEDVGFRWWNCLCLKPSNQRDCCWMNIMVLTFHPCWTYGVLLGEAHWVAEHNHCTYNRSVGCWIKALPVCSPTRQMKLIWADFLHL